MSFLDRIGRTHFILIFFGAAFLITWANSGFYHPDEHYSVLELLNAINGRSEPQYLNWDITLAMRSLTLPFIFHILKAPLEFFANFFNSDLNPFYLSWYFRFLGFLLHGYASYYFIKSWIIFQGSKNVNPRFFLTFLVAIWFIPFLWSRTSGENWSISFFCLAMAFLLTQSVSPEKAGKFYPNFLAGIFIGCSFFIRFQMGLAVIGLFLWLVSNHKDLPTRLLKMVLYVALGFLLTTLLATAVDNFYYKQFPFLDQTLQASLHNGNWIFTPFQYFYYNLVENRVSQFGVHPWWYYFSLILKKGPPPLGYLLLWGSISFSLTTPWKRNIFMFCLLPFLIGHLIIGHKELRFLFFAYELMALMFLFSLSNNWQNKTLDQLWNSNSQKHHNRFLLMLLGFQSLVWPIMTFSSQHAPLKIYQTLYKEADPGKNILVFKDDKGKHLTPSLSFYKRWKGGQSALNFTPIEWRDLEGPNALINLKKGPTVLILTSSYKEQVLFKETNYFKTSGCQKETSIYPDFLLAYNPFKWRDRSSIWSLWKCSQ